MKRRPFGEAIFNEAGQKKFISPKAVFVRLLCAAGHLIKHTSQLLVSAVPKERLDSWMLHRVNTP
jgi:hypothetical protein